MSIQCEQAVIGWGPRSSGKNVLAVSPGWPEDDYPRARLLADTGRFLQEGREVAAGPHGRLARAVEWLPRPGGPLLLGKAYLPKEVLDPEESVRLLADLGATVSLAHPMLWKGPPGWLDTQVARLKDCGLNAIEAWHSEHSEADVRACLALAKRFDLGISGGSDYHGENKPSICLGKGYGKLRIGMDVLESLRQRRMAAGLPV